MKDKTCNDPVKIHAEDQSITIKSQYCALGYTLGFNPFPK